jgi:hypothetical protein
VAAHIRKPVTCELFVLGYVILQMAKRNKWDSERMKAIIEAMRNKVIDRYKAFRVFSVPQTN